MQKLRRQFTTAAKGLALVFALLGGAFVVSAQTFTWTPPTNNPPNGNVASPINVSNTSQTKGGILTFLGNNINSPTITAGLNSGSTARALFTAGIFDVGNVDIFGKLTTGMTGNNSTVIPFNRANPATFFVPTIFKSTDLETTPVSIDLSANSAANDPEGRNALNITGGGWRTLNTRNVAITTVTPTAYHWQLYNGYWTTATPLSNFINTATGPNRVRIRYYSTTNTTSQLNIDYLRLQVVISPVYQAGSFVNLGTGVTANTYKFTTNFGQAGSDNQYATAAGTAGSVADFYFGFNNIKTYTGMNTILVRAEYSCSAINAAQAYRPKIYNFNSSSWEDLTTTNITCTTTDATNAWALNNVTIGNYISGGQVRVGFRGTTNYVTAIRVDLIYIILGTTNADTANCEISYGSGTATNCDATRNLDMTSTLGAGSTWPITTRDESTTDSATPYASDWDGDAIVF
jgi:hypothetical protein